MVLLGTQPESRPLLEEVVRGIGRRGAYAVVRIGFTLWPIDVAWASEAPPELLGTLPEIDRFASDQMDARITIDAPENTRGLVELVILGAGLELGVLTPPVYTMMVLMALVTTAMTTPVLQALGLARR